MILHHELKVINDMNDSKSWSHEFRWYEQLKVVDDMNDSGFLELRPLEGMNNSRVWMIWTILGYETVALKCYE